MATHGTRTASMLVAVTIVFLVFPYVNLTVKAQSENNTVFSPEDKFIIPDRNSSIRFAVNGSYADATLLNGVWTFKNLRLNNSQLFNNFSLSAKDSNLTVYSLRTSNFTGRSTFVRYIAEGAGTQTVHLDVDPAQPTHWSEWSVTIRGAQTVWLPRGQNWEIQPDNSIHVWGLTGNVSVAHYAFIGAYSDANSPYYMQHSITIITTVALIIIVGVALVTKVFLRRS